MKVPLRNREITIGILRFLNPAEELGRGHNVSGERIGISQDKGQMMSQRSGEERVKLCASEKYKEENTRETTEAFEMKWFIEGRHRGS